MNYLALTIFIIVSGIHLYASYNDNKELRDCTKPFILASLLGWYCFCGFEGPESFSLRWTVIMALIFSWLGDVFLMGKGHRWFAVGGVSFGISHLFFSATYLQNVSALSINFVPFIIAAVIFALIVVRVFNGLNTYLPKALKTPMFIYLLVNGMMNSFAFMQLYTMPCAGSVITFIGALLFFASDSILFYVRFRPGSIWKMHFPVMLTYILAEFLIVQGIMMIP